MNPVILVLNNEDQKSVAKVSLETYISEVSVCTVDVAVSNVLSTGAFLVKKTPNLLVKVSMRVHMIYHPIRNLPSVNRIECTYYFC